MDVSPDLCLVCMMQCESDSQTDGHVEVSDLDPCGDFPPLLFLPTPSSFPTPKKVFLLFSARQERAR